MRCDFSGFSIQDVLILIGLQARTGELELEAGNNIGTILFHEGKILYAFSPYSRAIGDLLVEEGIITEEELMVVLNEQKNSPYAPIGSLLMKTGKLGFEVVEMMVHEQIRKAVAEFTNWKGLNFHFYEKELKPFDTIHLTVYEFISSDTMNCVLNFVSRRNHHVVKPVPLPSINPAAPV